jgi:AraC family transcriptional regulator, arabinose operon regulatory protein
LEQVAMHVGLSVSRAVHLFKSVFDQSMMQHTIEVRLALARERILYSSFTLEQIAESCGYASYSYFHRMFRARFGISPKAYRLKEI